MTPRPERDWLSMFDDITNHWWGNGSNDDETARSAKMALDATGEPQGVHRHAAGAACVRGGGCYVLRMRGEQ